MKLWVDSQLVLSCDESKMNIRVSLCYTAAAYECGNCLLIHIKYLLYPWRLKYVECNTSVCMGNEKCTLLLVARCWYKDETVLVYCDVSDQL